MRALLRFGRELEVTHDYYRKHWRECVGPGWHGLVAPLVSLCEREGVTITQIKEKFGGLRFYTGAAPQHVHDSIDAAENLSQQTCEFCGLPGKVTDIRGWLKSVCPDHEKTT